MRKLYFLLLLILVLLSACNDKLLEPKNIAVESPETAPLFQRELYVDASGSFSPGYRSRIIRPASVDLQWAKSNDANFDYYQLYRGNMKIAKISDRDTINYLDERLREDRYYKYSVITVLKNRFSKSDTLTIKTPSLAPPEVKYRINRGINNEWYVVLSWIDPCEVPGNFEIYRDDVLIGTVDEHLGGNSDPVYSFSDSSVQNFGTHTYRIRKENREDELIETAITIRVVYSLNAPYLNRPEFTRENNGVKLTWDDDSTSNTGYKIYRRKQGVQEFSILETIDDPYEDEYIDTSYLSADDIYFYYVTGIDSERTPTAESKPSIIRSTTTMHTEVWRVALKDAFGDGWLGNRLWLRVNGEIVFSGITLVDSPGPEYHDFEVKDGDVIWALYSTGGMMWHENYYAIIDHNNNIVAESGGTWDTPWDSIPESIEFTVDFSSKMAQATAPQRSLK